MPLEPKLLGYDNTQFLLIGHKEGALEKATVPQPEDEENRKEAPKEEMEKLEHEDDLRIEHLKGQSQSTSPYFLHAIVVPNGPLFPPGSIETNGAAGDDSVFVDLGLDSKEYPKLQTTW